MLLIGSKNVSSQTILANGIINLGSTYRRYCRRTSCGLPTFSNAGTSITLNGEGIYHITATFVGAGSAAGDVTIQLLENGVVVPGALSTQTITTATTEIRTFVIDYYTKVDRECTLGCLSTSPKTISFINSGVGAIYSSVVVNIDKVV